MAKTYILEPTELHFNRGLGDLDASLADTPLASLTVDELKSLIPIGSIININNGDKFIVCQYTDDGVYSSRDGNATALDTVPEEYATFYALPGSSVISRFEFASKLIAEPGTYTVSIYTETEDDAPKYPTNNFDFSDHPRNDMAGIYDLLDDILGLKESENEETTPESGEEGGAYTKMSKTYILEPTELEFSSDVANGGLIASLRTTQLYGLTFGEFKNLIPNGAILDINNGDMFITAINEADSSAVATRDWSYPEAQPEEYAVFRFDTGNPSALMDLAVASNATTEPGTYTVSIYTETEDGPTPKYPIKNTSYELHGHSDVERIRYKLKKKAEHGGSSSGLSDLLKTHR